jgi:hypothetical protein
MAEEPQRGPAVQRPPEAGEELLDLTQLPLDPAGRLRATGARRRLAIQEAGREVVRLLPAGALVFILAVVIFFSFQKVDNWDQTKELLQILLPAVTALLGSAVGFYFGTRRE